MPISGGKSTLAMQLLGDLDFLLQSGSSFSEWKVLPQQCCARHAAQKLVLGRPGTWGDDLGLSENAVIMLDKAIQVRATPLQPTPPHCL